MSRKATLPPSTSVHSSGKGGKSTSTSSQRKSYSASADDSDNEDGKGRRSTFFNQVRDRKTVPIENSTMSRYTGNIFDENTMKKLTKKSARERTGDKTTVSGSHILSNMKKELVLNKQHERSSGMTYTAVTKTEMSKVGTGNGDGERTSLTRKTMTHIADNIDSILVPKDYIESAEEELRESQKVDMTKNKDEHLAFHMNNNNAVIRKAAGKYSRKLSLVGKKLPFSINNEEVQSPYFFIDRRNLLCELEFFVNGYGSWKKLKELHVIYVGLQGTGHLKYLIRNLLNLDQITTNFTFHIYNSRASIELIDLARVLNSINEKEDNQGKKRTIVEIHNNRFTDEEASVYIGMDTMFICHQKLSKREGATPEEIISDLQTQKSWYMIMQPLQSLLRFYCPFTVEYLRQNPATTFEYLSGTFILPVWNYNNSMETFLVVDRAKGGKIAKKKLNLLSYCEQMNYFLKVDKIAKFYHHRIPHYCHCYDCFTEINILTKYIEIFRYRYTAIQMGNNISVALRKNIFFQHQPPQFGKVMIKL